MLCEEVGQGSPSHPPPLLPLPLGRLGDSTHQLGSCNPSLTSPSSPLTALQPLPPNPSSSSSSSSSHFSSSFNLPPSPHPHPHPHHPRLRFPATQYEPPPVYHNNPFMDHKRLKKCSALNSIMENKGTRKIEQCSRSSRPI